MTSSIFAVQGGRRARRPDCATFPLALAAVLTLLATGCGTEATGVSSGMPSATDSAALGPGAQGAADSAASPVEGVVLANTVRPGIVFGTFGMDAGLLGNVHTGTLRGGGLTETTVGGILSGVRAKGGRIVLKLCNGKDSYVKTRRHVQPDEMEGAGGTIQAVQPRPYISDGTIVGHYLIDEPQQASGAARPSAGDARGHGASTARACGQECRLSSDPAELAGELLDDLPELDAGWAQYVSDKGNVSTYIAKEAAAAKKKGLGRCVGMNVLDGGNGSSGIRGYTRGKYAMSASEIRKYGTALLARPMCAGSTTGCTTPATTGAPTSRARWPTCRPKRGAHQRTSCRQ